ncbi:MAG: type II toxin-antitoxin system Phd/YefM family antitoxin [Panacagrimonas sp.]
MEISVSQFKAKCLKLMDEVSTTGQALTVTKHGKPLVVVAAATPAPKALFGVDAGEVEILGDIIEPIAASWDAAD